MKKECVNKTNGDYFKEEKEILKRLSKSSNENVVKLLDSFDDDKNEYLVMEYCNDGDLDAFVSNYHQEKIP